MSSDYRYFIRCVRDGKDHVYRYASGFYIIERNELIKFVKYGKFLGKFHTTLTCLHDDLPKENKRALLDIINKLNVAKTRDEATEHAMKYLEEINIVIYRICSRTSWYTSSPGIPVFDEEKIRQMASDDFMKNF